MELETRLNEAYDEFGVEEKHRKNIGEALNELKAYHEPTYSHSIRVGLKATEIAQFMHLNPKPALYGVLHDIGKLRIPLSTLAKTEGFDTKDMEIMKAHPLEGFKALVKAGYMFSAWLALTHHRYQPNSYPQTLAGLPMPLCDKTKTSLALYSRIVSLADHNDALKRKNDRFGEVPDPERGKKIMIDLNKDQECLINDLYRKGVLQ